MVRHIFGLLAVVVVQFCRVKLKSFTPSPTVLNKSIQRIVPTFRDAPRVVFAGYSAGGIGVTFEHDLHLYLRRQSVNRMLYGTPGEHRRRVSALVETQASAA